MLSITQLKKLLLLVRDFYPHQHDGNWPLTPQVYYEAILSMESCEVLQRSKKFQMSPHVVKLSPLTRTRIGSHKDRNTSKHTHTLIFIHALSLIFIECNIHSIDLLTHTHSLLHARKHTRTTETPPPKKNVRLREHTHTQLPSSSHMLVHFVLIWWC